MNGLIQLVSLGIWLFLMYLGDKLGFAEYINNARIFGDGLIGTMFFVLVIFVIPVATICITLTIIYWHWYHRIPKKIY